MKEFKSLTLPGEIEKAILEERAAMLYFSAPHCNVCKVLKPKIAGFIDEEFPGIELFYVDIDKAPLASGQFRIFTIPTILIYFEGKEFIRKSRNLSIHELRKDLEKPYSLLFEE